MAGNICTSDPHACVFAERSASPDIIAAIHNPARGGGRDVLVAGSWNRIIIAKLRPSQVLGIRASVVTVSRAPCSLGPSYVFLTTTWSGARYFGFSFFAKCLYKDIVSSIFTCMRKDTDVHIYTRINMHVQCTI